MKLLILIILITVSAIAADLNNNSKVLEQLSQNNHHQDSFSFAVMGDNRDGNNVLEKIISKINQDNNIDFAMNNGDLVPDGYKKEFETYSKIIDKSNKPFISIIGNHELPWYGIVDGEKNYKDIFGKTNFAFAYGNSYFIILDTSDKKIDKKQFQWLENELAKSQKFTNRFLLTHVPLYDPREGKYAKGHSFKKLDQAKRLNDMFDKYNVTMVFCSHIHFYNRGSWQKTPFIITGGAGAPLSHYKNNGFYHYVKVIVNGNDIKYKVIKINQEEPNIIQEGIQSIKDTLNLN